MKLDPLQKLIANSVKLSGEKAPPFCLLCGIAADGKMGAYLPREEEYKAKALTTGKIRVWLYLCCNRCAARPDVMKEVNLKIHSSNRVRSIEIQLQKQAFQIN